jgi:hypothetical protein
MRTRRSRGDARAGRRADRRVGIQTAGGARRRGRRSRSKAISSTPAPGTYQLPVIKAAGRGVLDHGCLPADGGKVVVGLRLHPVQRRAGLRPVPCSTRSTGRPPRIPLAERLKSSPSASIGPRHPGGDGAPRRQSAARVTWIALRPRPRPPRRSCAMARKFVTRPTGGGPAA